MRLSSRYAAFAQKSRGAFHGFDNTRAHGKVAESFLFQMLGSLYNQLSMTVCSGRAACSMCFPAWLNGRHPA